MRMPELDVTTPALIGVDAIREDLLSVFRNALGRSDFGAREGFLNAGGDSLTVIETILEIEQKYGVSLSAAEFMALDTAEKLSLRIVSAMQECDPEMGSVESPEGDDRTFLTVVQDGTDGPPLICTYGRTGEAAFAVTAAGILPDNQPVAALQVRAGSLMSDGVRSAQDLARSNAEAILRHYPNRPCVLLGYSLGAHAALAVGNELARRGSPPALIVVLDDEADLDRRLFGIAQGPWAATSRKRLLDKILRANAAKPIATRLVYIRSSENDAHYRSDPTCGWGEIATGGVSCYNLPFNHFDFVKEPCLRQIVPILLKEMKALGPDALTPDKAQFLRFDARRAAREGDLPYEISCLQQAIDDNEDQPVWVYANLAEALFQKGDSVAAREALLQARRRETWQLSLDLRFLSVFQKAGFEDDLADVLRRLAKLQADHPSVYEQKARVYFRLGDLDACERALRAGLAMHPTHQRLSRLMVRYLARIAAWPKLAMTAERVLQAHPNTSSVRTLLIRAYTNLGCPERALPFRNDIMTSDYMNANGLVAFGKALVGCNRMSEALEVADMAVSVAPSDPSVHSLRSECLAALGQPSEAAAAKKLTRDLQDSSSLGPMVKAKLGLAKRALSAVRARMDRSRLSGR